MIRRLALALAVLVGATAATAAITEAPASAASWCSASKTVSNIDLGSFLLWRPQVQTRQNCYVSGSYGVRLDHRNYEWHNVTLATALWYDVGDVWVGAPFG